MLQNLLDKLFGGSKRQEELARSQQQVKEIILKANEEALRIKQEAEREARKAMSDALEVEKRIETPGKNRCRH
jgi:F0F1-type ATP synthase membrane subunit b/b'